MAYTIVSFKEKRRHSHIARGFKGKYPRTSICGAKFKWPQIEVTKGSIELCTCTKCVNLVMVHDDLDLSS